MENREQVYRMWELYDKLQGILAMYPFTHTPTPQCYEAICAHIEQAIEAIEEDIRTGGVHVDGE